MSNLSEAQKEILTIEYFYPETSATTVGVFINVGKREVNHVRELVQKFVHTHEAFKMKLRQEQEAVQRYYVEEPAAILIEYGTEKEIREKLEKKAGCSFFCWNDYLYEMGIHVADNGDVYTSFFGHHAIVDGIGMHIYITGMYDLLETGECKKPLLTLDECVAEEEAYHASSRSEKSRKFWREKIKDYDGIALADSRKIDPNQLETINYNTSLSGSLTNDLIAYCDANGVTLTQLISGAILLYKSKMTNNRSVALNTTLHGRSNRRKRGILSTFARALPLIVIINEELSVFDYLKKIKSEGSDLMRNHKISHYDLVKTTTDASGLDDISISVQLNEHFKERYCPTFVEGAWLMPKESIRPLTIHIKEEKFAYEKDDELEEGIQLNYEFLATVFDEETIVTIHEKLEYLLTQMIASTATLVKDITLLTDEEYQFLIHDYHQDYVTYPKHKTIIDLFETQVAKNPKATALIYQDVFLSYETLNAKANQLAHYLIENFDIKPEDKIGLLLDRSEWMIIGILGVLKAGAAYVPISPEYPSERMNYIEEMAELKLTLLESGYGLSLTNTQIIQELNLADYPISNPITALTPTNLAYIIFTSGTTGRPKGVMIEHHQVNNFILARRKASRFQEKGQETILFASNYVFDASVDQIYSALLCGDQLLISPDNLWMAPEAFLTYLNIHKVSYIQMTPSLMFQIDLRSIPTLKYLMAGGESVTSNLLKKVKGLDLVFINGYGPTEATVATNIYVYEGDEERNIIGTALTNTTLYVLDENKQPVPKGVIGELHVGGVQVSRGYVKQPELTAERFIANPFQTDVQKMQGWNDRIYNTGDLVRMLEDGSLEYHGRSDFQVKIRGYRIELGEIEKTLLQIPGITEVYVTALGEAGNQYLGAYYVSKEEIPKDVLNAEIGKRLPEYMMPANYAHLEELPLTISGKVDHRALPKIGFNSVVDYVAPRNEIEEVLCETFKEILGLDSEVGLDDNFFLLGGDSIKGIRMISRLRENGYQIDVRQIMEHKTPRMISEMVEKIEGVLIEQGEVTGEVKLTPIQKDFILNDDQEKHHFNQSLMLESQIRIDEAVLRNILNELVKHHDMLRATYTACGKQEVKAYKANMGFDLSTYDYEGIYDEAQLMKAIDVASDKIQRSICLETGSLFKVGLFQTAKKDYLFLCIHHLVVDGVSWRILIEDFAAGYQLIENEMPLFLPQKTSSFGTWSEALRRYRESHRLKRELSYWQGVETKIERGNIAFDMRDASRKIARLTVELSEEKTNQLVYQAPQAYHGKLTDVLLTSVARGIGQVTGNQTVAINMEGHGRVDIHEPVIVDRTVGWFTSVYPVVFEGINKDIEADLCNVKETLCQMPNQGMGYGVLKSLGGEVLAGIKPTVTFNYLGEIAMGDKGGRFLLSDMPKGRDVAERSTFGTDISIDGAITAGKLQMTISYDASKYSRDLMTDLCEGISAQLEEVLTHCLSVTSPQPTASDFGELKWSHKTFKEVRGRFASQGYEIESILPLTWMQEGMLYHKLLNPSSSEYVLQTVFSIKHEVSVEKLRQSFELLMKKHQVLRTSMVHKGLREPRQVVLKERALSFTELDLSVSDASEAGLQKIYAQDVSKGFDLEIDGLMRMCLIKLSEANYRLVISSHHIILDGWSTSIIMNDFLSFYDDLCAGESDSKLMNEWSKQKTYSDYVRYMTDKETESSQHYWKHLLADYEGSSSIAPTGFVDKEAEVAVDVANMHVTEKVTLKLEKLAKKYSVTLNTVVEAVWGIMLGRYNSERDIVFGKVVSGRNVNLSGIESMVGLFINTLPVRVTFDDEITFEQLLLQLHEQALSSGEHDDYPLVEIQKLSGLDANLIQTTLAFENYFVQGSSTRKHQLDLQLEQNREETNYDLTLVAYRTDHLMLSLMYNPNKYGKMEVQQILERFQVILRDVLETPSKRVLDIEMMPSKEAHLILNDFNDTQRAFPETASIASQFEEQVKLYPNKVAVESKTACLTYEELDAKANEIAERLVVKGLKKEEYVAVIAKRDVETVIGFLGVLKAGGAYMPMDADYPEARIAYLLEDSDCRFILGNREDLPALEGMERVPHFISLSELKGVKQAPKIEVSGDDLAYLIYTSGTTGKPKGVMVEQKSVTRLVKHVNYVDLEDVRILQTGSLSFDASTFEIWGALLNGGYVYLSDLNVLVDHGRLKEVIKEKVLNTAFITVALYNQLITSDVTVFDGLNQLMVGGEAMSVAHVNQLLAEDSEINFMNIYGPTETTTFATYLNLKGSYEGKIPIGRPITNTTTYVINEGKLCGIGMLGELCIGGPGVARGYLNNSELTSEKFIDNPYGEGRLYRTGDLVRWLPDGTIDYLGRLDDQVKIRGHRIELPEVESAIRRLDGIDDAVVIVREGQLHAYIQNPSLMDHEAVKSALRKELPDYMVPSHYLNLESFPLTSNGKVNKKALPEIELTFSEAYVAPTTPMEEVVAASYCEILDVSLVGIHDNFFQLGGHSLRALKLVNLLEERTGKAINVKHVFEAPKVFQLAILLEGLNETVYERIPKAEEKLVYEMSSTQKRMYLLWKLSPSLVVYNMPTILRFEGRIDERKLSDAIQKLTQRHDILRTTFVTQDGNLIQMIGDVVSIEVTVEAIKEIDVKTWYEQNVQPFDLEAGPMCRLKVGRTEARDYLFVDIHHIISDGMSHGIFVREINQLMAGGELSPLDRQYKDYSEWMRTQDLSDSEAYWTKQLQNYPILELPTDYPRPLEQQFAGATEQLILDEHVTKQVKALIQKTNTTEYMFFLGVISILLSKLTNQDDLIIGSPVSGRIHRDTEMMLGMFVNTLAMRVSPKGEKTFESYLEELKVQTLTAGEHQAYPLEDLVEKMVESRDHSRSPLFDVLMVYQNNEAIEQVLGTSQWEGANAPAKFDLTFTLSDNGKETFIDLTYGTSLFSKSTIQTYFARLTRLLDQILTNSRQLIKKLDVILEAERKLILGKFNETSCDFPATETIAYQFEAQVKLNPTKIAVQDKSEILTYEELDAKANEVAHHLIAGGLQPEDYVAIVANRNVETVIGFLATLKAGGAYMPIDADYPESRIEYMLEDSKAAFILGNSSYLGLSEKVKQNIQFVDLSNLIGQKNAPKVKINGNSLAYLIYTSGTTGKPKGVMVEQQSITRLVKHTNYGNFDGASILQTGSLSFDASTFEIWGALLNGGCIYISSLNILVDYRQLKDVIDARGLNMAFMTVALFNELVISDVTVFDGLNQLLVGGEAISTEHANRLLEANQHIELSNVYGPTETTTLATSFKVVGPSKGKIPIGKPISNTTTYIMTDGILCGIGIPGELCIGGPGVARGYLNRPDLTSEMFIDNPFGTGKLYRTGDLVRWLPDGNIEFLGRFDDQVKIRGHRIELGEIESALKALSEIDDAVVLVRESYLHAYLQNPIELSHDEIKNRLKEELPDYMIPTHYLNLETFPITNNGKVNKRALPLIEMDQTVEYIAPTTTMEMAVASSYEEVLNIEQVGINDDFFQLGGHSLRALKLANLLEARTGKAIQVKHVFEAPKVCQLATLLDGLNETVYERIPKAEEKPLYEMSSTQKRMYLLWKFNPNELAYNMPGILKFDGHLDEAKLTAAINALTARHDILRTTFTEKAGTLVQVISTRLKTSVSVTELEASELKNWQKNAIKPFNLEEGPMYRVAIARTKACDYLFVDMHHIISDGMSSTIFVKELNALMDGADLPELDRQYKDYSEWMITQDLNESEQYWLTNLADYPVLELPTDYPRPKHQQFEGATEKLILDEKTTSRIKNLIHKTHATEYMFFMGVISILLSKLANQDDLIIGSPVSGRVHKDTESMLGMFVNTLAMRMAPVGDKTFATYLEEVKAQTLEAQEHQTYPFEDLVEQLVKSRDASRNPLFDVLVVYQNNEASGALMNAVSLEGFNAPAKFDLNFNLVDDGKQTYIDLTYATSLFTKETIQTYLARFSLLLEQILTNDNQLIKELNVALEAERKLILGEFNNTTCALSPSKTVIEQFEEQVANQPTQIAIEYQEIALTYEALNAKANQLAHYLIHHHQIKPEDKIGLLLDRSHWMIISILGIMKAGAAFVPISPEHPEDRKVYITENSQTKITLVDAQYASSLANGIIIQDLAFEAYPTSNPKTGLAPNHLAYVIFTSGTTGNPKGVMLEHQNLTHYMNYVQASYVTKTPVVPLFTNYTFDLTITSIFLPLITGGKMIIYSGEIHEDIEAIFSNETITFVKLTPSHLEMAMMMKETNPLSQLETLIVGGEELTTQLSHETLKTYGEHIKIHNEYGPTEATVGCCDYIYKFKDNIRHSVSIGKPITNIQIYILNDLSLCGIGMIGELCIAGAGVARGYLNHPDLTAEKFIDNPFGPGKLYRTGDLARWLPDGTIDYLGRIDDQVKIRGYRIELGEIEHALLQISSINQAHVIALGETGNQYLGAYYASDEAIDRNLLEQELAKYLPNYMMPAGYQHVTEFPLTVNGKLDRRALPEIGFNSAVVYVAPTTELEKLVATGFEEVLNLDQVGINDDFFQLGGHSLRALRLVNLLAEKTGKELQIKHLFEAPKVMELAILLEDLAVSSYKRIPKAEEKDAYQMSPSQEAIYKFWKYVEKKKSVGYNMPMRMKFKDRLDEALMKHAFEILVARHESFRTTFMEQEGEFFQIIHDDVPVHISIEAVKEAQVKKWFNDNVKPFDLENGPLLRVKIARTESHDHLLLDMHHMISDGRSHAILIQELSQIFAGIPLPVLERQYRDYSEWLNTQDLKQSEAYWLEYLDNCQPLQVPTDYPRQARENFNTASNTLLLEAETTTRIRQFVKETNTTEYMFFLALLSILVGKHAKQEDVLIASYMSGRIHHDLDHMLGVFTNTIATRTSPVHDKSFNDYLAEIKAQTLEAYDHQTYPLSLLPGSLDKKHHIAYDSLYNVAFIYQNNEVADPAELGVIEIEEYQKPDESELYYSISDNGQQISSILTYATQLFKPETIQLYQTGLKKLIEQVLAYPEKRIGELDI